MKINLWIVGILFFNTTLFAFNKSDSSYSFSEMALESSPEWQIKYDEERRQLLDVDLLMKKASMTRLEASEVQNYVLDRLAENNCQKFPSLTQQCLSRYLNDGIAAVKKGKSEHGVDLNRLEKASFVVVFDLDETLYDQFANEKGKFSVTFGCLGLDHREIVLFLQFLCFASLDLTKEVVVPGPVVLPADSFGTALMLGYVP